MTSTNLFERQCADEFSLIKTRTSLDCKNGKFFAAEILRAGLVRRTIMPMPVLSLLVDRHRQHLLDETGCAVACDDALGILVACFVGHERSRVLSVMAASLKEVDFLTNGESLTQKPTLPLDAHKAEISS